MLQFAQKMKKFPPQARVSRRRDERDGAGRASRRSARRTRTDWRRARVRSASPTGRLHSVCIAALPGSSDASCFVPFAPRRAPTAPRPHAVCSPTKVPSCCCCLFFFSLRLSSSLRRFYSRVFLYRRSTFRQDDDADPRIQEIHAVMDIIRSAGILRGSREPGCRFTKTTSGPRWIVDEKKQRLLRETSRIFRSNTSARMRLVDKD